MAEIISNSRMINPVELSNRVADKNFNQLSDLYHLFNGDVSYLILHKSVDHKILYNEAYEEGLFVKITQPYADYITVQITDKVNVTETTKHLLSNLQMSDRNTVSYEGPHNIKSIRAAVFRLKDFYSDRVRVMGDTGNLAIAEHPRNKYGDHNLEFILDNAPFGQMFTIPLKLYRTVIHLRSAIQRYGVKRKCKFTTRVAGDDLEVVKSIVDTTTPVNNVDIAREYVKKLPYDVPFPISYTLFNGASPDKVKSLLRNQGKNTLTFKGNTVTRHTFRLCMDDGHYKLFHRGENVYETPDRRLTSIDKAVINDYLRKFNHALVKRKIVKVEL